MNQDEIRNEKGEKVEIMELDDGALEDVVGGMPPINFSCQQNSGCNAVAGCGG